jgi:hypothetical protein
MRHRLQALLGLILIGLGVLALIYRGIPYKDREQVLDVGPLKATLETEKRIEIPPGIGAGAVGVGVILLILGLRK